MFDLGSGDRLDFGLAHTLKMERKVPSHGSLAAGRVAGGIRTGVLVVEFQKVTLLVELVGMAVEKSKDGLQLGDGIFGDVHEGRLVGGQRA